MQNNEDEIINELLALGILRHKNRQLVVSDNFYMVLDAESFMFRGNPRHKIMSVTRHTLVKSHYMRYEGRMRWPGFEPGSTAWQAAVLDQASYAEFGVLVTFSA